MRTNRSLAPLPDLTPAATGEPAEFIPQSRQGSDLALERSYFSLEQMLDVDAGHLPAVPDGQDLPDLT